MSRKTIDNSVMLVIRLTIAIGFVPKTLVLHETCKMHTINIPWCLVHHQMQKSQYLSSSKNARC